MLAREAHLRLTKLNRNSLMDLSIQCISGMQYILLPGAMRWPHADISATAKRFVSGKMPLP